ncbi:MAG: Na+/H+ antiporter subunit E [Hyphomicrobiales bacterium]|nr:MAG: Na+/H+ antiporter subunit E [Hyphomicrobiales bacterium]
MSRLLPYPLLWVALLAMWLTLNASVSLAQVLLGAVVATLGCWAVRKLQPPKARMRSIGTILTLVGYVVADVVQSNIAVIRLILSGREPRSEFLTIPLELKDPNGLAILSCIVTATPGSAWIHYDSMLSKVTIHVLDTGDGIAWTATLKRNYEQRLLEIFQ